MQTNSRVFDPALTVVIHTLRRHARQLLTEAGHVLEDFVGGETTCKACGADTYVDVKAQTVHHYDSVRNVSVYLRRGEAAPACPAVRDPDTTFSAQRQSLDQLKAHLRRAVQQTDQLWLRHDFRDPQLGNFRAVEEKDQLAVTAKLILVRTGGEMRGELCTFEALVSENWQMIRLRQRGKHSGKHVDFYLRRDSAPTEPPAYSLVPLAPEAPTKRTKAPRKVARIIAEAIEPEHREQAKNRVLKRHALAAASTEKPTTADHGLEGMVTDLESSRDMLLFLLKDTGWSYQTKPLATNNLDPAWNVPQVFEGKIFDATGAERHGVHRSNEAQCLIALVDWLMTEAQDCLPADQGMQMQKMSEPVACTHAAVRCEDCRAAEESAQTEADSDILVVRDYFEDHDDQSQAPAYKRDPVPEGCEACAGCPDCLQSKLPTVERERVIADVVTRPAEILATAGITQHDIDKATAAAIENHGKPEQHIHAAIDYTQLSPADQIRAAEVDVAYQRAVELSQRPVPAPKNSLTGTAQRLFGTRDKLLAHKHEWKKLPLPPGGCPTCRDCRGANEPCRHHQPRRRQPGHPVELVVQTYHSRLTGENQSVY